MVDHLQPGQDLGSYRLIGQIGQGGMATVYKAYHAATDRYVAIKVLPRQLAENPEFTGRFQQEARTIARLEHARILPVYDYGESHGLAYLVMRYLDAGTLKDRMGVGLLSLAEVDRLFTQLAEALDYAHRQGVVHRDLKPSNAMVDSQGNLFLTDFGIAKLLEGGAHFTSTGAMMGTPAYMSPEQAQGDKVDQRTDIYSLGIILYELTTGRVPFEAETPLAVVLKQISAPLPPPTSLKADLAPEIERVLLKALAKSPEDRFQSVAEFLGAWKSAVKAAEVRAFAGAATVHVPPAADTVAAPPRAEATQVAPAAAAPAARPGLPPAAIIGAVGVVMIGLIFVLAVLPNLRPRPAATATAPAAAGQPTAAIAGTAAATAPPGATEPAGPVTPADGEWASWTAANLIRQLRVVGDRLYAAGPGGLTVWDLAAGEVVARATTGAGLPHANVFDVWVDDDGTLWVATEAGLARQNAGSAQWITYDTADGLDSNLVTALVRTGDFLVAGTYYSGRDGGGLNLFDGRTWQPAPDFPSVNWERAQAEGRLANHINVLLADDAGLWVGTEAGLGRFDRAPAEWRIFTTDQGLPDNRISALYVDSAGALLVGTQGGAARFDGDTFTPTDQAPPDNVLGIVQDSAGRYYFSGGGGIWRFDAANANWDEFSSQTGALPVYGVGVAVAAADGTLFFGSDGVGPIRYDGTGFVTWYQADSTVVAWHDAILPLPDESALWFVEAYGAYADRFDLGAEAWAPYIDLACECRPLAFDADGNLWGGRWAQGFVIETPEGGLTSVSADEGLPTEMNVRVLQPGPDGSAWLGTDEDGLALYEGGFVEFVGEAEGGPPAERVWSLFLASDGALWAGVGDGVSRRDADGTWEHFRPGDVFDGNFGFAADFAEDADGAIWVATAGAGAYRYLAGDWEQFLSGQGGVALPSAYLYAAALGPDESLWFGGEGGAARFDGAAWTVWTVGDGLMNNLVNDIYVEPSGAAWFATAGGVSRYSP